MKVHRWSSAERRTFSSTYARCFFFIDAFGNFASSVLLCQTCPFIRSWNLRWMVLLWSSFESSFQDSEMQKHAYVESIQRDQRKCRQAQRWKWREAETTTDQTRVVRYSSGFRYSGGFNISWSSGWSVCFTFIRNACFPKICKDNPTRMTLNGKTT